ncbi:unnamed protein product, partial [Aphanomyces euteiches]
MSKRAATGKSAPQDPTKEALKAARASIATADQMRQLLTECVSNSAELADQQKQVQDQLKAESDEVDPDSSGEPQSKKAKKKEPPPVKLIEVDAEGVAALRHFPNLDGGSRLKYIE